MIGPQDEIAVFACNKYSNLKLKETPTLFLEFHSTEVGLNYETESVKDIAKDYGGSDFEFAIQQEVKFFKHYYFITVLASSVPYQCTLYVLFFLG